MLAIFVCGDLFGLIGVLLGVPTFSVLYAILKTVTAKRLEDRNISYEQIVQASKSEVLADTVPVVEEKVETKEKIDQVKKPPKKL